MRFGAPEPLVIWAQLHAAGSNLAAYACVPDPKSQTARNRRVKDARLSVTGPLSAAFARYLRMGDSDFGAVKARFIEMAT
jgi:hypothetical protein